MTAQRSVSRGRCGSAATRRRSNCNDAPCPVHSDPNPIIV